MLIVACVLGAFAASWMLWTAAPGLVGDRVEIVVPFVPLTVVAVVVAATRWAHRARASVIESLGAPLTVGVITLGIAAAAGGMELVVDFWLLASLLYAPWWLLGVGIAWVLEGTRLS